MVNYNPNSLTDANRGRGRPKGQPNTWRKSLQDLCDAAGYDPAMALMHMAHDPKTPLKYRYLCHKTLFDRAYPQRHVVAGDPQGAPIAMAITWNDGDEPTVIDAEPLVDAPEGLEDDTKPSEE